MIFRSSHRESPEFTSKQYIFTYILIKICLEEVALMFKMYRKVQVKCILRGQQFLMGGKKAAGLSRQISLSSQVSLFLAS